MNFIIKTLLHTNQISLIRYLYSIKINSLYKKSWVMGRVACLGTDVYNLLNIDVKLINNQKGRIDYLLETFNNKKNPIVPSYKILRSIKRDDIKNIAFCQFFIKYNSISSPRFLIMDSLSELVDQKFTSRTNNNSYFFAYYSDVEKIEDYSLRCDGLIETDSSLKEKYYDFFSSFRKRYPTSPIFYINFPKKLETRKKFIYRHDMIKEMVDSIANQTTDMYTFDIPEEIITFSPLNQPYHYNKEVYSSLAEKLKNVIRDNSY